MVNVSNISNLSDISSLKLDLNKTKTASKAISIARAPAKLILSGEHAVLYGSPSLAIAIDIYADTTVSYNNNLNKILGFDFANLKYNAKRTLDTLSILKNKAQSDYNRFLRGECNIKEVLNKPFELLQFALSNFLEQLNINLPGGLNIKTDSNIPTGCGLGSSAATIMSLLYAVGDLLDLNIDKPKYIELARAAENLQHGKSSGIDLNLTTQGGCIKFQSGKYKKLDVNYKIHTDYFYLINTGIPIVTTGQCVIYAKKYFVKNNSLKQDFEAITNGLEKNLIDNKINNIILDIQNNHKLLDYIKVVPSKVSNFIANIEKIGGAAKICGAGAVSGDNAGAVLAVCNSIDVLNNLKQLCKFYNYSIQKVNIDSHGIRIL